MKLLQIFALILSISVSSFVRSQTSCSGAFAFGTAPPIGTQSCLNGITINDAVLSTMTPSTACGAPNAEFWMSFTVTAATAHSFIFDMTEATGPDNIGFQILGSTTTCGLVSWAGTILDCDNDGGNNTAETETLFNLPNGTYFVRMLSYTGSESGINYCITGIPDPPANDNPCGAINVPVGAAGACTPVVGNNTGATTTNPTGIPAPGCGNYLGGDVWYSFVAPASGNVNLTAEVSTPAVVTDLDFAVYSAATCAGPFTLINCDDLSGTGVMPLLSLTGLNPGQTYYVRAWEFSNDAFGTFNLCFSEPPPFDPNQDCSTSNQLCSSSSVAGASNGSGGVSDLTSTNQGCLFGENQANWYFTVVSTAGNFEFTIDPVNGSDDYDYGLWHYPGGAGQACPPTVAPTRCSFASGFSTTSATGSNNTGVGPPGTEASDGTSGTLDGWSSSLPVAVGDIIVILVDNFSSTTSPFSISFPGTAGLNCTPTSLGNKLVYLKGVHENNSNFINFELSQNPSPNTRFLIERLSADGKWEMIATLNSNGKTYNFEDVNYIDDRTNHYKVIEETNSSEKSELGYVSINTEYEIGDLRLFPNPSENKTMVSFYSDNSYDGVIEIIDNNGIIVLSQEIQIEKGVNNQVILLENLKHGLYNVQLNNGSKIIRSKISKI